MVWLIGCWVAGFSQRVGSEKRREIGKTKERTKETYTENVQRRERKGGVKVQVNKVNVRVSYRVIISVKVMSVCVCVKRVY